MRVHSMTLCFLTKFFNMRTSAFVVHVKAIAIGSVFKRLRTLDIEISYSFN